MQVGVNMYALENATRFFSLMRGLLALIGLVTVVTIAWPSSRETLLQHVTTMAEAAEREGDAPAAAGVPVAAELVAAAAAEAREQTLEQRAVAEFISRRYRVAAEASSAFVRTAYRAGSELSVDPLLILAVVAIESRFNPVAESAMGAMGLMQVIPKHHPEKILPHGGAQALLDPHVNIQIGTQILREYMRRFGELEPALQKYAGAFDEPTARYTNKVLAEKARLKRILAQSGREA